MRGSQWVTVQLSLYPPPPPPPPHPHPHPHRPPLPPGTRMVPGTSWRCSGPSPGARTALGTWPARRRAPPRRPRPPRGRPSHPHRPPRYVGDGSSQTGVPVCGEGVGGGGGAKEGAHTHNPRGLRACTCRLPLGRRWVAHPPALPGLAPSKGPHQTVASRCKYCMGGGAMPGCMQGHTVCEHGGPRGGRRVGVQPETVTCANPQRGPLPPALLPPPHARTRTRTYAGNETNYGRHAAARRLTGATVTAPSTP